MNSDTMALIGGSILSAVVAIATSANADSIFELVKGLSSSGVLAITFWWLMQRFEKRLDEAFNDFKVLNKELLELLKEKNNNDK